MHCFKHHQCRSLLDKWYKVCKLPLNYTKTKSVTFQTSTCSRSLPGSIETDGHHIEIVPYYRILGINFDSRLTWKHHIDLVSMQLSSAAGLIHRCWNTLNYEWLLTLHNALFLPSLNYCCLTWGSASPTALQLINIF